MAPKDHSRAIVYMNRGLPCAKAIRTGSFVKYCWMLLKAY